MSFEDELREQTHQFANNQTALCPRCTGLSAKGFEHGARWAKAWIERERVQDDKAE